jgi:hypothetical protein
MGHWPDDARMEPMRNARTTALARIQEAAGPAAHQLADRMYQAIDFQLTADLRYREAERAEAIGLNDGRAQAARRVADRYNAACIELLTEEVPSALREVRDQFGDQRVDFRESLAVLEAEGLEQLASMDLKGDHAAAAAKTIRETVAVANDSGISGLCERLQNQTLEFAELRRERPLHNDPVTVIVGALMCGIAATMLGVCWALTPTTGCRDATVLGIVFALCVFGGFVLLTQLLAIFAPAA